MAAQLIANEIFRLAIPPKDRVEHLAPQLVV
jgi:hypothetical protein